MKKIILILLLGIGSFLPCMSQYADSIKQQNVFVALATVYKGDTIPSYELYEVTIYGRRTFSAARKQRRYDKLTNNVIKMYPLALEVKAILVETYLYL